MKAPDLYRQWIAAERGDTLQKVRAPIDTMPTLARYVDRSQEHFIVITLNGAHEIIGHKVVTKGLANRTVIHPREIFRYAIRKNAVAVILAHNHPSGALDPSPDDDQVTYRLKAAGDTIGIPVLDHVIVSRQGYYSFLEHDRL